MATVEPIPPSASYPERVQPPSRAESIATVDMHIPGAWVGTNPSTPAPISEDMKYFGERLKTLPQTVQGYLPKDESGSTKNAVMDKAAAIVPASVMNTATNILPASMQPTAGPTASDAIPPSPPSFKEGENPIATTTNTVPHDKDLAESAATTKSTAQGNTIMDKAAAFVPAGVLSAAAAYLPSSFNPTNAPTASDAAPTPTGEHEGLNAPLPAIPSESSTSVPHDSTKPLIGSTVSPDQDVQEALANAKNPDEYKAVAIPSVSNEATPLEKPAASQSATETNTPIADSKGQQDTFAPAPMAATVAKKDTLIDKIRNKVKRGSDENENETTGSPLDSTRPIGGMTPITPASGSSEAIDRNNDGHPKQGDKGAKGLADIGVAGIGAYAVDHSLKDQKNAAAIGDLSRPANPPQPTDSFAHVVIPATPGAGFNEQEMFAANQSRVPPPPSPKSKLGTLSTPDKKHKHERSGSISNGEVSPSSSPSKSAFSGLRKLTKKKNKSTSRSHSRGVSVDEGLPAESASTAFGGSAGAVAINDSPVDHIDSNTTTDDMEHRERHRLHKDPPGAKKQTSNDEVISPTSAVGTDPSDANSSAGSGVLDSQAGVEGTGAGTPPFMSNPYDAPPAKSPTKVGFKDKVKGEFMVVQGSITRDKTLKEAGERMKKGTF